MPTEIERHALYEKIKEDWGEGHADVLMSHLPPVGWADVATKHDLAALQATFDARFERVDAGFDSLEARFDAKFVGIDARFVGIDARFDTIDARFDTIDAKFETAGARFDSKIDTLRSEMHQEFARQHRWTLGSTMTAMVVLTGLFVIIVGVLA